MRLKNCLIEKLATIARPRTILHGADCAPGLTGDGAAPHHQSLDPYTQPWPKIGTSTVNTPAMVYRFALQPSMCLLLNGETQITTMSNKASAGTGIKLYVLANLSQTLTPVSREIAENLS